MVENRGVQWTFELAPCFMLPGPNDLGLPTIKSGEHDVDRRVYFKLGEALYPETCRGEIGQSRVEPAFTRPSKLNGDKQVVPVIRPVSCFREGKALRNHIAHPGRIYRRTVPHQSKWEVKATPRIFEAAPLRTTVWADGRKLLAGGSVALLHLLLHLHQLGFGDIIQQLDIEDQNAILGNRAAFRHI